MYKNLQSDRKRYRDDTLESKGSCRSQDRYIRHLGLDLQRNVLTNTIRKVEKRLGGRTISFVM